MVDLDDSDAEISSITYPQERQSGSSDATKLENLMMGKGWYCLLLDVKAFWKLWQVKVISLKCGVEEGGGALQDLRWEANV